MCGSKKLSELAGADGFTPAMLLPYSGQCQPWLSLLLTSGCSSTPIGTIIMMSPMEIVATLVGRKRAMVDLATLCETPPPPLLASPTAAAGRCGSHNDDDTEETGEGMVE